MNLLSYDWEQISVMCVRTRFSNLIFVQCKDGIILKCSEKSCIWRYRVQLGKASIDDLTGLNYADVNYTGDNSATCTCWKKKVKPALSPWGVSFLRNFLPYCSHGIERERETEERRKRARMFTHLTAMQLNCNEKNVGPPGWFGERSAVANLCRWKSDSGTSVYTCFSVLLSWLRITHAYTYTHARARAYTRTAFLSLYLYPMLDVYELVVYLPTIRNYHLARVKWTDKKRWPI